MLNQTIDNGSRQWTFNEQIGEPANRFLLSLVAILTDNQNCALYTCYVRPYPN